MHVFANRVFVSVGLCGQVLTAESEAIKTRDVCEHYATINA